MSRLRLFLIHQRASWRALFRWHQRVWVSSDDLDVLDDADRDRISHPSQFCRCFVGSATPHDVLADHEPGCRWVAAMCERCAGTGWCIGCGGDGTRPDWDPEKTPAERPSARRIA